MEKIILRNEDIRRVLTGVPKSHKHLRALIETYRGISKENLHLYCAQYIFLRNTREEDRARRAAAIAISTLTNIEKEPCTVSFI